MSNLSALENYNINSSELKKLLSIYTLIGEDAFFKFNYKSKLDLFTTKAIVKDSKQIVKLLNLNVSTDRVRLLLEKDSSPKTTSERSVKGIYKVLNNIFTKSSLSDDDSLINSSDILDYLKLITLDNVKFNTNDFLVYGDNKKSVRYKFNEVLDEYQDLYITKKYENLMMVSCVLMELYNMNPYTNYNKLAFILTFEYLLLRCNIYCFKYTGFLDLYLKYESSFIDAISKGSINFSNGVLFIGPFFNLLLDFILEGFSNLSNVKGAEEILPNALKSDLIEQAIIYDLPSLFTKLDVKKMFPDVSDTTIMRVLTKLKNDGYIIPLGTGRSAMWQRIVDKNDKKIIFGEEL